MTCASCRAQIRTGLRFCPRCGTATGPGEPLGQPAPGLAAARVEYMGFWVRLAAAFVDGIVVALMVGILAVILVPALGILGVIIAYLSVILYHTLFIGFKGQTLGKMALGVKVVNAQGEVPGFWRAALSETIGKFVSGLVLNLGYLWAGWDRDKRSWHDHIASTYVVRAPGR